MPRGAKPKVYPVDLVKQVTELYAGGQTQDEIAVALGLTQRVIWRLMERNGIARRVAAKRDQYGPKNHMWKGEAASYKAFHQRLERLRGQPKNCACCGTSDPSRAYDWANLTGRLENPDDYMRMCRSCHWKYDKKHKNPGDHAVRKEVRNAS